MISMQNNMYLTEIAVFHHTNVKMIHETRDIGKL